MNDTDQSNLFSEDPIEGDTPIDMDNPIDVIEQGAEKAATEEQNTEDFKLKRKELEGRYLVLGTNAIWTSPSGNIKLNALTGKLSHKLSNNVSNMDFTAIFKALDMGLLNISEKEVKGDPIEVPDNAIPTSLTTEAYRMIDIAVDKEKFEKIIHYTTSLMLLNEMLTIEKQDKKREWVMIMIKKQIKELMS